MATDTLVSDAAMTMFACATERARVRAVAMVVAGTDTPDELVVEAVLEGEHAVADASPWFEVVGGDHVSLASPALRRVLAGVHGVLFEAATPEVRAVAIAEALERDPQLALALAEERGDDAGDGLAELIGL